MRRQARIITLITTVCAGIVLSACGGGGGGGAGASGGATYDPNGTISISSLTVTGTSASVSGVAPISPGVNGGQFTVSFNASGTALPTYSAYIYMNTDGAYPGSTTNYNIAINCGATTIGGPCAASVATNCVFDNTNTITCNNPIAGPQTRVITGLLSGGVPKNAYVVVRVCNALSSACSTANAPIQLQ
jgi:hypothetical protein